MSSKGSITSKELEKEFESDNPEFEFREWMDKEEFEKRRDKIEEHIMKRLDKELRYSDRLLILQILDGEKE